METNIKTDMKKRARIVAGIVNLLSDDATHLKADANDFDIICLEESLKDARATIQMLSDHITEMEYMLYLFKSEQTY